MTNTQTTKHTPCWKLEEREVMRPMETKPRTDYTLTNWDGTVLASIFDVNDGGKAARLIAAAPDLLDAFKAEQDDLNTLADHLETWTHSRLRTHIFQMQERNSAAISAAEGK